MRAQQELKAILGHRVGVDQQAKMEWMETQALPVREDLWALLELTSSVKFLLEPTTRDHHQTFDCTLAQRVLHLEKKIVCLSTLK